jgi:nitrogen fixation NifU-like protein
MSEEDQEERLQRFARELQEKIYRDILETYGPTALDHLQKPRNLGLIDDPHGYARLKGTCGDTMEMSVRMEGDTVAGCGFTTDGCGTTVVCGSVATELAKGRTLLEALGAVTAAGILAVLGGLPEAEVHCAELAAGTLRRALADHLYQKNTPWKKDYRKI